MPNPAYSLLSRLLFTLDAETAHDVSMKALSLVSASGMASLLSRLSPPARDPVTVMGLAFPNRVGLAAGLDKNGAAIDALAALGFGHIEIGTVTPRPQPGNPAPRLFRLPEAHAIINRMGFNNLGVDALLRNVGRAGFPKNGGILGVNIGKNADTPLAKAADDYLFCLEKVYPVASYVTINISSPNTKNLRDLQHDEALDTLLARLKSARDRLADQRGRYVPLALKIAPDLEEARIPAIAQALRRHRIDAAIATNTTLSRAGVEHLPHGGETGGLSGAPLFARSTETLKNLVAALEGELPVVGAGGILSAEDARAKIAAGASLVQIYTGLIYQGPGFAREIARALAKSPFPA
ncbi:MAG: quinone-dependent dihydroorotate dehydrogenase [Zoogloeaceae bacterium]|jgi:dihydroorotate dehydrogenase|nr:quinone-dependent dihydroorotate dehydrogenase [Zoogloeaceae bacterium]